MRKEDLEDLVGESMDDMGLTEVVEDRECEDCGHLMDDNITQSICVSCRIKQLNQL